MKKVKILVIILAFFYVLFLACSFSVLLIQPQASSEGETYIGNLDGSEYFYGELTKKRNTLISLREMLAWIVLSVLMAVGWVFFYVQIQKVISHVDSYK